MPLPVWPVSLPRDVRRQGFAVQEPAPQPLATEYQSGDTDLRAPYGAMITQMTVAFRLTPEQLATFHAFLRDDLGKGSKHFTGPVPPVGGGAAVDRKVQIVPGTLVYAPLDADMTVTMRLRVWDWL